MVCQATCSLAPQRVLAREGHLGLTHPAAQRHHRWPQHRRPLLLCPSVHSSFLSTYHAPSTTQGTALGDSAGQSKALVLTGSGLPSSTGRGQQPQTQLPTTAALGGSAGQRAAPCPATSLCEGSRPAWPLAPGPSCRAGPWLTPTVGAPDADPLLHLTKPEMRFPKPAPSAR